MNKSPQLFTLDDNKETDQSWHAWFEDEDYSPHLTGYGPTEQAAKMDLVAKLEAEIDQLQWMIQRASQP